MEENKYNKMIEQAIKESGFQVGKGLSWFGFWLAVGMTLVDFVRIYIY